MDFIYKAVKKLTFPGAHLKKTVELLLCLLFRIPAPEDVPDEFQDEAEYLSFESLGHTEHSEFFYPYKAFFYCAISTLFCAVVGLVLYYPAVTSLFYLNVEFFDVTFQCFQPMVFVYIISGYLGFSILSNLFPTPMDIGEMWFLCIESSPMILRIILIIPCLLLRIGSFLERYGLTSVILIAIPFCIKFFM